MTLEQLRIFLAVVQNMHFTRAAESLYITQSAVSAAIRNLEREYKVKLFHRMGRYIDLTDAGNLLRVEAQRIFDQLAVIERGLKQLNDLQQGELKLGVSQTIGNYWLPKLISQFKRQYPGVQVKCTLANSQEISAGTAKGLFDLGLVEGTVNLLKNACLEEQVVGNDYITVVVGPSHPWFGEKVVSVTDLLSTQWVMQEKASGTRQRFEEVLEDWGVAPDQLNVALEANSDEVLKAAVERGMGATVISELLIEKEIQLNMLRHIQIANPENTTLLPQIHRPFYLIKHRERFQSPASRAFEDTVNTIESDVKGVAQLLNDWSSQKQLMNKV